MCWRLTRQSRLSWLCWDSEIVVYDDASGHTHGLDSLAAGVFETLIDHRLSMQEIIAALGDPSDDFRSNVAAVIAELKDLDLITDDAGTASG